MILNANKAVGCGIFRRFSNLDKFRPEAGDDSIFGVVERPGLITMWWVMTLLRIDVRSFPVISTGSAHQILTSFGTTPMVFAARRSDSF